MSSISRIECPPSLTEQVYQRLLNAICDGELAPGARLTQEDLAVVLAVSRQPVLQALRLLKKDGFVTDAGRRGLRVAPLEAQALAHVYEVRTVLDGLAARRAGQRPARQCLLSVRSRRSGLHVTPQAQAMLREAAVAREERLPSNAAACRGRPWFELWLTEDGQG